MTTKAKQDSLIWGVILIVIGLIFFLDNINFNVWRAVARLWPVVLIAWGAWKLYYGIKDTRKKDMSHEA
ncbi:MAG: LiaF transmembrane domain-containing protein [Candidatus Aminicenantaceae bacterium]